MPEPLCSATLDITTPNPQILWLGVRVERRLGDQAAADRYAKELKERFPTAEETLLLEGQKAP